MTSKTTPPTTAENGDLEGPARLGRLDVARCGGLVRTLMPLAPAYFAGAVAGAPFCLTKKTRNFAGLVVLALRETVWMSSGDS